MGLRRTQIPSGNPEDACHGARVETLGQDGIRGSSFPKTPAPKHQHGRGVASGPRQDWAGVSKDFELSRR